MGLGADKLWRIRRWCILYLNSLPLGRLNPLWRERLGQDWTGRQSILSDGLNLETDSWAQMGDSLQRWRNNGAIAVVSKVGAVKSLTSATSRASLYAH